jgi:hypothetical protein
MLRALVLVLVVLASSASCERSVATSAVSEVRAGQLAKAEIAKLEESSSHRSGTADRHPIPPGPPPAPGGPQVFASTALFVITCVVVHEEPPRDLPVAREVARRDQRAAIFRVRHQALDLDPSSTA